MAAYNSFSAYKNHKSLLEEVENTNDLEELKQISRTLINEHRVWSRRSNAAVKGLERQNVLIKYLQDTLNYTMARNAETSKLMQKFLGRESLYAIDNMIQYHTYISCLYESNIFKGKEKRKLKALLDAISVVPAEPVEEARERFIHFLTKLEGLPVPKVDIKVDVDDKDGVKDLVKNIKEVDVKDDKEDIKHLVKKENAVQKEKSKKKFKYAKSSSSRESSKNFTEDVQARKFSKKRGSNKKAKGINKSPLVAEVKSEKISSSECSVSSSINKPIDLKGVEIKLTDFMQDTSAVVDPHVVKFKQAMLKLCKMNEENLEAVDIDSHQKVESNNFDDDDDETSFKSLESEDNLEEDSILSKSTAVTCEEGTESNTVIPNKKTLSLSDIYVKTPDYIDIPDIMFRRGPRTPSLSPPAYTKE